MFLKFLFCFLYLIQTGWSANMYRFENNRNAQARTTHHAQHSPPYKQQHYLNNAPIIYEKEYFYFSAPEDMTDETEALNKFLSSVSKRQQVIFIKTPVNDAYEIVLQNLLQSAIQQNTHIYVFGREPNYDDLKQRLQQIQRNIQHKPEVHFLKYRNPLEAQHIQSAIVGQYNKGSDNRFIYPRSAANDNTPVKKNYAMNFLPRGVDVVPGSSYIPLLLL